MPPAPPSLLVATVLACLLILTHHQLHGVHVKLDCKNSSDGVRLVRSLEDFRFNASTYYSTFRAHRAKITIGDSDSENDQAWCPNVPVRYKKLSEWVQVTLPRTHILNNLLTSPRQHTPTDTGDYSKRLFIQYKRSVGEEFRNYSLRSFVGGRLSYQPIIEGNSDAKDRRNYVGLVPPIVAQVVRFYPVNPDPDTDMNACLKFELFGCRDYQGLVAYTAPQGHATDDGRTNFSDHYYDGIQLPNGTLTGGLGQLADYTSSSVSPGTDPSDQGIPGLAYVGWNRYRLPNSAYVELTFEFEAVRRFRSVQIHANNDYNKWDARLFTSASVAGSVGGVIFHDERREAVPPDDGQQFTRPVFIFAIDGLVGRFVRLRLAFSDRASWMLLAEVFFESNIVPNPPPVETPQTPVAPRTPPPPPPTLPKERIEQGGGGGGGSGGSSRENETTTYVAIIVSILLGAVLLMLGVAFLCLRRRLLRKKQRGGSGAHIQQQQQHQAKSAAESIHLDFSSGRPAMLVNGKLAHNGSIYTSLPLSLSLSPSPSHSHFSP